MSILQTHHDDTCSDDCDLPDPAQADAKAKFAAIVDGNIGLYRDKKRSAGGAVSEIVASALASGLSLETIVGDCTLAEYLATTFSYEGAAISTTWANQVRQRATAARKADYLAQVSTRLNNQPLAEYMFRVVWEAEQSPVEAVRHKMARPLEKLFQSIAADLTEDEQTVALGVLDDSYLGTCLVEHGGIPQAWADFRQEQAAAERQKVLDRLAEVYGRGHFSHDDDRGDDPLGDAQGPPPAVWGAASDVLWSAGESLIIEADIGVGKTTLAGLLVRALLFGGDVLGQRVRPLAPGQRVLYLALDRPEQMRRAMARQLTPEQRAALAGRLVVWDRPLPADPAKNQNVFRDLAEFHGAAVVVVDSLKDAVPGLSDERVAFAYDAARKRLLATGRELVELHHLTKGQAAYGSVFIPAGAGSIVRLSGAASGTAGTLTHRKPPAHIVGPLKVIHDRDRGEIELRATAPAHATQAAVEKAAKVGLVDWVIDQHLDDGATAVDAAQYLHGSTAERHIRAAKRALNNESELARRSTSGGRGVQSRWFYVDPDDDGADE